ncbi:Putative ribonuclease H protein At1g65750 [Linum perenne]
MMKLAFIFMQDSEKPWVKVLQGKYLREGADGFERRRLASYSPLWKGLSNDWESMLLGARSAIRNGQGTLFWTARWVDSGIRLLNTIEDTNGGIDLSATVADFTNEDNQWDVDKLTNVLTPDQVCLVLGMSPPRPDSGDDGWVWGSEPDGKFTIKSAYRIAYTRPAHTACAPWKECWNWRGPNRIRLFLWLAVQEKLLTNKERCRRNMATSDSCELCHLSPESIVHVLRDCNFAREVWRLVGGFDLSTAGWGGSAADWLKHGLTSEHSTRFGIVCWLLWKARNERIFAGSNELAPVVARRTHNWVVMVNEASGRCSRHLPSVHTRRLANVAWTPGPPEWITLNTDGSFDARRGRAAAGGLARDSYGRCRFAYTMNLGSCSITRAEMRGATEGLRRAWDAGYRRVVLQLDSQAAITLLNSDEGLYNQHGLEIENFRELRGRDWMVVTKHTYREGNHAADYLASIGYDYPFGSHSVSLSNCNLGYFLRYDCLAISEQREIFIND